MLNRTHFIFITTVTLQVFQTWWGFFLLVLICIYVCDMQCNFQDVPACSVSEIHRHNKQFLSCAEVRWVPGGSTLCSPRQDFLLQMKRKWKWVGSSAKVRVWELEMKLRGKTEKVIQKEKRARSKRKWNEKVFANEAVLRLDREKQN